MKSVGSFLSGLLTGAALGGIAALLLAPRSGKETREKIKENVDEIEKELSKAKESVFEKPVELRNHLAERLAALKREIDDLAKKL